jgi:SSS family transporter
MLFWFVIAYWIVSVGIGLYAATRVHNTRDFAIAGRHLPFYVVVATVFATWFGSETVLGIPATFLGEGLHGIVADPFGASLCLILVGLFFAAPLYRMNLLTIGDFYRKRYGRTVETVTTLAIVISYLGWVGAQITALGLVFNVLSDGGISRIDGMWIGSATILIYTLFGGMWAVAVTDFLQMIIIVVGMLYIGGEISGLVGGVGHVVAHAQAAGKLSFWPTLDLKEIIGFFAAWITMMLGSIPQQDVFQRVMSAKDSQTARNGAMIGGFSYLAFAFVPMFIVASSLLIMPDVARNLLANDPQKVLPTLILTRMPLIAQIFFFGALVSAIKSTSSATLLAPSTSFVENILKNIHPGMSDRQVLLSLRITILVFTGLVLTYAIKMQGTAIYDLVSSAYQVTLVGAFVPLSFGLYWKRATAQGAVLSIVGGIGVWAAFLANSSWGDVFPGQLAGLLTALFGMVAGSMLPQLVPDHRTRQAHMA